MPSGCSRARSRWAGFLGGWVVGRLQEPACAAFCCWKRQAHHAGEAQALADMVRVLPHCSLPPLPPALLQMPAAIPQAVVQSRHGSRHGSRPGSHQTSPKAIPAPPAASAHLAGPLPNSGSAASSLGVSVGSVPGLLGTSLGAGSGFITPPLGSSPAVGGGGLLGAAQGLPPGVRRAETMPAHLASGGGSTAALPPGSPLGRPERGQQMPAAAAAEAARQQQQQPQEGSEGALPVQPAGAAPPPEGAAAKSAFVLPQGLPPLLSPDYAINAFVTRLAFDLLRRPDFQASPGSACACRWRVSAVWRGAGGRPAGQRAAPGKAGALLSLPRLIGRACRASRPCPLPSPCRLAAGDGARAHPAPAVPPAAPRLHPGPGGGGGGVRRRGAHAAQLARAAAALRPRLAPGCVRHELPRWVGGLG